jgi:hypothetical protein
VQSQASFGLIWAVASEAASSEDRLDFGGEVYYLVVRFGRECARLLPERAGGARYSEGASEGKHREKEGSRPTRTLAADCIVACCAYRIEKASIGMGVYLGEFMGYKRHSKGGISESRIEGG